MSLKCTAPKIASAPLLYPVLAPPSLFHTPRQNRLCAQCTGDMSRRDHTQRPADGRTVKTRGVGRTWSKADDALVHDYVVANEDVCTQADNIKALHASFFPFRTERAVGVRVARWLRRVSPNWTEEEDAMVREHVDKWDGAACLVHNKLADLFEQMKKLDVHGGPFPRTFNAVCERVRACANNTALYKELPIDTLNQLVKAMEGKNHRGKKRSAPCTPAVRPVDGWQPSKQRPTRWTTKRCASVRRNLLPDNSSAPTVQQPITTAWPTSWPFSYDAKTAFKFVNRRMR